MSTGSAEATARGPLRIGAVGYLNARPLTWALDRRRDRWRVRYDVPSVCATLLHDGDVDLGLVPSIEYLRSPEYRFVPGVGIGSRGPVASVALYARRPIVEIGAIALDTSSRTSVALIQVLCRHHFRIQPTFVPHGPDLAAMMRTADAALLIGDPAFDADHNALGVEKIDLGEEWTSMTGLPFIYAAWTGRAGAASADDVRALQEAQAEGVRAAEDIAAEYGRGDSGRAARALAYLRDNVKYGIGPDEARGLQLFLDYAADLGLAPGRRRVEFF
ncbi:MAG TPA: menaquinone biosynthesis protein [Vicinamibacterales bacterium]|nr:menaquinone biosynthesis protein [Vicinamibacterales bacterium]